MTEVPAPPRAARIPHRIEQLGRVRMDEYAWMKDESWQQVLRDPTALRADIRAHLEAENAYTRAVLAGTEALQKEIIDEIKGRMKQDDASVPVPDGAWEYYVRYEAGAQHPVHARSPRGGGPCQGGSGQPPGEEQELVDADALAKGHAYYRLAAARHSPDHRLFAYAEDTQGSEVYRVCIKDLATGALLPDAIESCTGNFAWSPDSAWLFWTYRDDNGRPVRVYRRPVRGSPADDVLVYEEPDPGFFLSVSVGASRTWMVIACGDQQTSEAWLVPAADPTAAPRVVEPRQVGLRYDVEHWDGRFVIRTNADDAVDFKLVTAPESAPNRANWRDWIGHQPGRYIVGTAAYAGHFARLERIDANNRIVITRRDDGSEHVIAVDEEAFVLRLQGGSEYDTDTLRYTYESPTTPRQWLDFDMRSHASALRKAQEIPSGHDPAQYVAHRLHARAADGALVPVTVLMRRDTPADGSAPLLLYGYGSYGIAMEPNFSIRALSLVNRGWIWATAHVRGGSEKGWGWFLDGRGAKKPNTFTDFIAAAEHLADQGLGRRGGMVAMGGSAGGLLVGAVANMRPDLWAGIVANVPFVDVLNTMSDTTLPLTPPEWPEWGNPLEDAGAYDTIAAYSPYDNVAPRPYPAILATAGLSDPRVTYWEPAKWIARLREATTSSSNPSLLWTNMDAGHGGAAGRFDALKDTALHYAFAIWAHARSAQPGTPVVTR